MRTAGTAQIRPGARFARRESYQQAEGKMIRVPIGRVLACIGAVCLLGALTSSACPALAASPWWQLASSARPANIKPGSGADEVQTVTVSGSGNFTLTVTTAAGFALTSEGSEVLSDAGASYGAFRVGDGIAATIPGAAVVPADTTITAVGKETLTVSGAATRSSEGFYTTKLAATETTTPILAGASAAELEAALQALPGVGAQGVEVTGAAGGPYKVTFEGALSEVSVPLMNAAGSATAEVREVMRGRPDGELAVTAENLGDAPLNTEAGAVTIADILPPNLRAVAIAGSEPGLEADFIIPQYLPCSLASMSCTFGGTTDYFGREKFKELAPYDELEMRIAVKVLPGASALETNRVSASGGGAPAASLSRPVKINGEPTRYGVEDWRLRAEEEGGGFVTQAGSHPFQVTGTVAINQGPDTAPLTDVKPVVEPAVLSKDITTVLPAGLIGDPVPLPRCSMVQFVTELNFRENGCPQDTAIGVASVTINEPAVSGYATVTVPLFNLEPYFGEPARFGFFVPKAKVPVVLDTSIRSGPGEDYGIDVKSTNISQVGGLTSARVTFWGVPDDPRHDNSRGWECLYTSRGNVGEVEGQSCEPSKDAHPPAFLTMPTSCEGPLQSSAEADSWPAPGVFATYPTSEPLQALDGCNQLPFTPTISVEPTTDRASAPSGLDLNLDFHDEGLTSPGGLAQSQLKDISVALPEGLTINPSAGVGLAGCTPAGYANETISSAPGAGCPNESKLGTVEIETPLLTQTTHGAIFIAQPYENPFGSLVALYIVAKNPETGVLIKLAGEVEPNPTTGQLTTVFKTNPQLAFDHFNFHFREGQQAPLITPPVCGTFNTAAQLAPWSEPANPLDESSAFTITKGFDGGACPSGGVPPFAPQIQSGTLNNNAGAFSPFYLRLTRTDAEQEISSFSTELPAGLTGDLSGIPFCPDADIETARHKTGAQEEASPSCPAASQIGHTLVGTGVGAVLAYVPGRVYLAGPFHGAPFSLVAVTSAKVGPFDLGTVVLRFGLKIDPYTARVSVDPTSSEPIPTILDGIVTHVRDIRVYVDRHDFILNPTSCDPTKIGSTLTAHEGARASITSPFQAASCAGLKFEPQFAVSTQGKTSRANGASLSVKLTYPPGALGSDANIKQVKVELPKALPSRLTTLQKACTKEQFEANPAGCPPAALIGHAKAVTPLIPVPLEGPAYFVSNGNEAFPNLIMVLQGYGVTIDLVGDTFISKTGVTSSTFKAVPDEPVGSFELTLPEGPYSALTANRNLCATTKTVTVKKRVMVHGRTVTRNVKKTEAQGLEMPSEFVAQNGAAIHRVTLISVTGCAKARKVKKQRHSRRGRHS
jgi:hypothetical protein